MPPEADRDVNTTEAREDYNETFEIDGTEQRYVPLTVGEVELKAVQIESWSGPDAPDCISAVLYSREESLKPGFVYSVSTPHHDYGEKIFAGYTVGDSDLLLATFDQPDPDTVKINGIDPDAFQVEYFSNDDAIGEIAVGVPTERSNDLPALVVSAGEPITFQHAGSSIQVTLTAVQFEGPGTVIWFDRA
jgi:hypothetical protein